MQMSEGAAVLWSTINLHIIIILNQYISSSDLTPIKKNSLVIDRVLLKLQKNWHLYSPIFILVQKIRKDFPPPIEMLNFCSHPML